MRKVRLQDIEPRWVIKTDLINNGSSYPDYHDRCELCPFGRLREETPASHPDPTRSEALWVVEDSYLEELAVSDDSLLMFWHLAIRRLNEDRSYQQNGELAYICTISHPKEPKIMIEIVGQLSEDGRSVIPLPS